jgi:beta-phosphoglucomutase-like phosphatase (HAD superfamily)
MRFQAVIFDMDGLMLDTERVYRDIFNRAAAGCEVEFPDWLHMKLLGRNTADMKAILREFFGGDEQMFERYLERNRHHHKICFADAPPLKQGLEDLLDFIESKTVPKAVATSTPRRTAIPRLEQCGLLHRFVSVSCGDDVANGKPAPDLFLMAAKSMSIPPEKCVVLEDSEAGVRGAHAAGMSAIMVPDLKQPADDVRQIAHGVYESLVHVRDVLAPLL